AGEVSSIKASGLEQANAISRLKALLASGDTAIEGQKQRIIQLEATNGLLSQKNEQLTANNKKYSEETATDKESLNKITERKNQLEIETEGMRKDIAALQGERNLLKQQNTQLVTEEESRRKKYDSDVAALTSIRDQIQNERASEIEEKNKAAIAQIKGLKE